LKALRHFNKRFPTGRVLAIYSYASRPNITEVRRAGARELIAFPFTKEGFLAALDRLVGMTEHDRRQDSPAEGPPGPDPTGAGDTPRPPGMPE
jgi:DNA-binding NtrC family response regulator